MSKYILRHSVIERLRCIEQKGGLNNTIQTGFVLTGVSNITSDSLNNKLVEVISLAQLIETKYDMNPFEKYVFFLFWEGRCGASCMIMKQRNLQRPSNLFAKKGQIHEGTTKGI